MPAPDRATTPLTAQERAELHTVRGSRTPLVLVLVSLTLAMIVPEVADRRISGLRHEINEVAEPARARVAEIQLDIALEAAARRGFLLTGDAELLQEIGTSRARRVAAQRQLGRYAVRLDPPVRAEAAGLERELRELDAHLDSVVASGAASSAVRATLRQQQGQFTDAFVASQRLGTAIARAADARRERIAATERAVSLLTGALVLLALGAAVLVARLGSRFRAVALRLDEDEARFRQIAENLTAVVWLSDPEMTRLLYVNRAFDRIWGRPPGSLFADPDSLFAGVHPDDRERVRAAFAGAPEGADVEFRVVRPDGDVRWVWARGFPVRDDGGRVFRVAGIMEDITDRRRHAVERERLLEDERRAHGAAEQRRVELERVTESRARLIRGFTHDVKNPLGAADGYLALLEQGVHGELSGPQRDAISRARRAIGLALELIRHLLDIARAEAGQLEIHADETDVGEVLHETAETFQAQAGVKRLAFRLEHAAGLPRIVTDRTKVRQVIGNLVSNALKYTPPGGAVVLRSRLLDGDGAGDGRPVVVEVSDTGPGIPGDKLPTLFMEFTRFDPEAAEGAGIGLAISHKIAQALGAEITVESRPGGGSTFRLHLPLAVPPRDG